VARAEIAAARHCVGGRSLRIAAVRLHHELLDALEEGVAVFGGASMGALRAAELWQHGMVGVGKIFRAYRDGICSTTPRWRCSTRAESMAFAR